MHRETINRRIHQWSLVPGNPPIEQGRSKLLRRPLDQPDRDRGRLQSRDEVMFKLSQGRAYYHYVRLGAINIFSDLQQSFARIIELWRHLQFVSRVLEIVANLSA